MSQWHLSYGGQQIGPLEHAEAIQKAREHPEGHAWKEGFTGWLPIKQVDELSGVSPTGGHTVAPPPLSTVVADDVDFKIFGEEMQYVEVELDPGESAVAEAGAMMYT